MSEEESDKKDLLKLINENPDLPLIFYMPNGESNDEFGTTILEKFYCYVDEIYFRKDGMATNKKDIIEYYFNVFSDKEQYLELDDDKYEKEIENYIESNIEHYKAIIINVFN